MELVVGIDIGGTNTKIGIVQSIPEVKIITKRSIKTQPEEGPDGVLGRITEAVEELVAFCGAIPVGVGVGCPGVIAEGIVRKSPNLPSFEGFPLGEVLQQWLKLPVEIQNDANAAVLGEYLFGPNRDVKNLILLTLGTGIGGGVIADGKLLQGADYAAAELGHLKIVAPGGAPCGCGRNGCIEAYVGSAGIVRLAEAMRNEYSTIGRASSLLGESLNTKLITTAAKHGDKLAIAILRTVGEYLGRGIGLMIDTFNPEKVLLGGGASAAIESLLPGIKQGIDEFASFPETRDRTVIERAAFPDDINVLGAAATFVNSQRQERDRAVRHVRSPLTSPVAPSDDELVLGIHIGASSCHAGLLTTAGNVISRENHSNFIEDRREKHYEDLLDEAVDASMRAIATALEGGFKLDSIIGVGVVVPAPVHDHISGHVGRAPALKSFKNKKLGHDLGDKLRTRISELFGKSIDDLPCCVGNDADGASLTERYFGEAREIDDFVTVHLCTGLGGSIFFDGKLYKGHNKCAGEMGHIIVQPSGEKCGCGSRGCLETIVSGRALIEAAQKQGMSVAQHGKIHYSDLISAARKQDEAVLELFKYMGKSLGIGVASIINVLNPALVVFTGKLAGAHPYFSNAVETAISRRVFVGMECPVVCSQRLEDSEIRSGLSTFLYSREQFNVAPNPACLLTV